MRVIGGRSRGRTLLSPPVPGLRPTSDRVREAIFDVLGSRGGLDGLAVLDLFAGTGALGIEALSRGARQATFVERDRTLAAAIGKNLARIREPGEPEPHGEVVRGEALGFLRRAGRRFDVAFCDPPYRFGDWEELLGLLDADVAVLESDRPVEVTGKFQLVKVYRYGGTLVTLAEGRHSAAGKGDT